MRYLRLALAALMPLLCLSCASVEVSESEHRDGYTVSLVGIPSPVLAGESITSYLLVPDGVDKAHPAPAVLMLHDHGARFDIGKEKLARPLASAEEHVRRSSQEWIDRLFEGVYLADSLCAKGYVVLVPDALYWGGRSVDSTRLWSQYTFTPEALEPISRERMKALKDTVYEGQRDAYRRCVAETGLEFAEVILRDDIAALEYLSSLPEVDPERIGSFGFSMGAHRSWLLAAALSSPGVVMPGAPAPKAHLRCAVVQNWMTLLEVCDTTSASSLSMSVKELRSRMDIPQIAALASPTPMLVLAGSEDHLFPKEAVDSAFAIMHSAYEQGALATQFFDGVHECTKKVHAIFVPYLDSQLMAD